MVIEKINIEGVDYDIAGSSASIYPELYQGIDRISYIKCPEGQIKDTDTLKFARYGIFKLGKHNPSERCYKAKGWVTPYEKSIYPEYRSLLHPYLEYYRTKDGYDYWKIMCNNKTYAEAYKELQNSSDAKHSGSLILHHKKGLKFGFAVIRDGVLISDYVHCSLRGYGNAEENPSTLVPW